MACRKITIQEFESLPQGTKGFDSQTECCSSVGSSGTTIHNGSFSDEDSEREGMDPIAVEDAVDLIMHHVEESMETPEEMAGDAARVARQWRSD